MWGLLMHCTLEMLNRRWRWLRRDGTRNQEPPFDQLYVFYKSKNWINRRLVGHTHVTSHGFFLTKTLWLLVNIANALILTVKQMYLQLTFENNTAITFNIHSLYCIPQSVLLSNSLSANNLLTKFQLFKVRQNLILLKVPLNQPTNSNPSLSLKISRSSLTFASVTLMFDNCRPHARHCWVPLVSETLCQWNWRRKVHYSNGCSCFRCFYVIALTIPVICILHNHLIS